MQKCFYAVARGKVPGIYTEWQKVKPLIFGFKYAQYKKFDTYDAAEKFMQEKGKTSTSSPSTPITVSSSNSYNFDNSIIKNTKQTNVSNEEDGDEECSIKEDSQLIAFTDGSAIQNEKASFAVVWPKYPAKNYGQRLSADEPQTNNRGELHGVIYAIQQANEIDPTKTKPLTIYTDSELVIKTATKWLKGWKLNDWKKSDGKKVANVDLIKQLDELLNGNPNARKVEFRHVRAHTNSQSWTAKFNRMADTLSKIARKCDNLDNIVLE